MDQEIPRNSNDKEPLYPFEVEWSWSLSIPMFSNYTSQGANYPRKVKLECTEGIHGFNGYFY